MRGSFLKDANLRREFLALMDKNQGKQWVERLPKVGHPDLHLRIILN